MGKRQESIAHPSQDAGEAHTSTTSPHVNDNLPSTSSRSSRGFSSCSPNSYHHSPTFEANPAPVADFSAGRQHRGASTYEQPNVPPNPPQSESYMRAYGEGYVAGYYQAVLSGATVAQIGPPLVPMTSVVVPNAPFGAGVQPFASPTYFYPATHAGSNPSHHAPPTSDAGPAVHSQAPGWGSGGISQSFGRNRNPPALHTFQLDPLGTGSTSAPQGSIFIPSPTHSVVIVPQPISGPPTSAHGDESHECTWSNCGKSFRRRYLLEDHVSYAHGHIKRHTCPAESCGHKYAARAGLMKHVKKNHPDLVGTRVLSVGGID